MRHVSSTFDLQEHAILHGGNLRRTHSVRVLFGFRLCHGARLGDRARVDPRLRHDMLLVLRRPSSFGREVEGPRRILRRHRPEHDRQGILMLGPL